LLPNKDYKQESAVTRNVTADFLVVFMFLSIHDTFPSPGTEAMTTMIDNIFPHQWMEEQ